MAAGGDAVRDPDAFARSMPAELFKRWEAYHAAEPWGYAEDWRRAAMVGAAVTAAAPFRGKDARPVQLADFLPAGLAAPPKPSRRAARRSALAEAASMRADSLAFAAAHGLRIYRGDGTPAAAADLVGG